MVYLLARMSVLPMIWRRERLLLMVSSKVLMIGKLRQRLLNMEPRLVQAR